MQARTKDLVKNCKEQTSLEAQYRQPWIVFDRDKVENFNDIITNAHNEGVNTAWSNPCIEIWFDAYFGKMHSYNSSVICCKNFAETFKRRTGKEYSKNNLKIYEMLNDFGNEEEAIQIAKKRHNEYLQDEKKKPSEMSLCSTMYTLVEDIKKKVF